MAACRPPVSRCPQPLSVIGAVVPEGGHELHEHGIDVGVTPHILVRDDLHVGGLDDVVLQLAYEDPAAHWEIHHTDAEASAPCGKLSRVTYPRSRETPAGSERRVRL